LLRPQATLVDLVDESKQRGVETMILGGSRTELGEKRVVSEGVETCHGRQTMGRAGD
jgi:hypothetical protein